MYLGLLFVRYLYNNSRYELLDLEILAPRVGFQLYRRIRDF